MASIKTHLPLKPSALFLAFEMALVLLAATKPMHLEQWPSLIRRKKKWCSSATDASLQHMPRSRRKRSTRRGRS